MAIVPIPRAPIEVQVDGADPRIKFVAVSEQNLSAIESDLAAIREENERLKEDNADHETLFILRHDADVRAIKRWRKAHPGNELVLPDQAELCVWLLDQDTRLRRERDEARKNVRVWKDLAQPAIERAEQAEREAKRSRDDIRALVVDRDDAQDRAERAGAALRRVTTAVNEADSKDAKGWPPQTKGRTVHAYGEYIDGVTDTVCWIRAALEVGDG